MASLRYVPALGVEWLTPLYDALCWILRAGRVKRLMTGLQGAGKSMVARFIVSMLDPSPAPLRSEPRDVEGWSVAASGSWIVALDNLSHLPAWFQDCLCRAYSGDGLVRRGRNRVRVRG